MKIITQKINSESETNLGNTPITQRQDNVIYEEEAFYSNELEAD